MYNYKSTHFPSVFLNAHIMSQSAIDEKFYFRLIVDTFHQSSIGIYVKGSCIYHISTIHAEN